MFAASLVSPTPGRGEGHSVRNARLCEVFDCQPGDLFAFENPAADVAGVAS
jgi:hypothetical protein